MVASFPGQLEKRPGFCCSHRHLIFRHSQGIHDSIPLCCDIHSVYTFDNVHKTWILLFCMPSSDSEVKQWCLNSNKRVYKVVMSWVIHVDMSIRVYDVIVTIT